MAAYKVERVPGTPKNRLGEGPHWDEESQSLYYVDVFGKDAALLRYDFAEKKTYTAKVDGTSAIGFILPVVGQRHQFAVGVHKKIVIVEWDGKSLTTKVIRDALHVEKDSKLHTRFNDAKADPTGRFYGGTMRHEDVGDLFDTAEGSLYKYAKGEDVGVLADSIGIANGLAWNLTKRKMYYIDSCQVNVREYDWCPDTGKLSNERIFISFRTGEGRPASVPGGMTIDANGDLYVATYNGGKVVKVNGTTGKVEMEISLPAVEITSVALGGPNLDILFVTSGSLDGLRQFGELDGSLFQVTGLGVKGLPASKVRL